MWRRPPVQGLDERVVRAQEAARSSAAAATALQQEEAAAQAAAARAAARLAELEAAKKAAAARRVNMAALLTRPCTCDQLLFVFMSSKQVMDGRCWLKSAAECSAIQFRMLHKSQGWSLQSRCTT